MCLKKKGFDDDCDKKGGKSNTNAMGDWRAGQIIWCDKSFTQGVMNPELVTVEDPDEGKSIHIRDKKKKLYHFDAKEEKCNSEICFKT